MPDNSTHEFVDVQDFTRNVQIIAVPNKSNSYKVTGDGVFDEIMETVNSHIQAQSDSGRIKEEQFASVYTQLTTNALNTAVQLLVQKPISDRQEELLQAQIETEKAKKLLYERQTKGFDDDAKQKVLKVLLDVWGLGFSVAKDNADLLVPESINKKTIDSLVRDILVASDLGAGTEGEIELFTNPYKNEFVDNDTNP